MNKDEAKEKSGFALNPIGYTGTFFVPKQLSIGGFVKCRILEVKGDKFFVELEDGSKGEIPRQEFSPMLIIERKEE